MKHIIILIIFCLKTATITAQTVNYNYLPVKVNGKYGFIDTAGKYLLRPDFDYLGYLVEGRARVSVGGKPDDLGFMEGGKWTFIDSSGNPITEPVYDAVSDFSEGRARVMKKSLYGFIDGDGKEIIPCQYADVTDFHNGYAQFEDNGLWGSMDPDGNIVIAPRFNNPYRFDEDRAAVGYFFNKGYINPLGRYITDSNFFEARNMNGGLGIVVSADSGLYGMVDAFGSFVIPCRYGYISGFSEGLSAVNIGGTFSRGRNEVTGGCWGFIDKNNTIVISAVYENAGSFSEGLCPVRKKGKWGYIDKDGNTVIPARFPVAFLFSSGLARIIKSGKYGFIDRSGKIRISVQYDDASDFIDGSAIVNMGRKTNKYAPEPGMCGKYGVINRYGHFIIPPEFDGITREGKKVFRVIKGNGWGYYNTKGECIFVITE
ncbi:MAG TPA: WG repeat-containing protein [Bacteroidales bacterium]|nr:WG repeat-containing protein [Bacteroidales bacterium]